MMKVLENDFKRSKSYLAAKLYERVCRKLYRGRPITFYMIQNWMYKGTNNSVLDQEFSDLLKESEPSAVPVWVEVEKVAVY